MKVKTYIRLRQIKLTKYILHSNPTCTLPWMLSLCGTLTNVSWTVLCQSPLHPIGSPVGSPLLCIVKYADDTTVVGLLTEEDKGAYRDEVEWLLLNISKTKGLIIDHRRKNTTTSPLSINREKVERVTDFRFLGVQIDKDLTWSTNTSELLIKSQQRLPQGVEEQHLPDPCCPLTGAE